MLLTIMSSLRIQILFYPKKGDTQEELHQFEWGKSLQKKETFPCQRQALL